MELKEYLRIFRKRFAMFTFLVVLAVAGAFSWNALRPVSFKNLLILNVTRTQVQETSEYQYGQYYRILADEKFTETVTNWLKTPTMSSRIFQRAQASSAINSPLKSAFKPEKLSSHTLQVWYNSISIVDSNKIAEATVEELTTEIVRLNANKQSGEWFAIVADGPSAAKKEISTLTLLIFSLLAGMFVGLWVVFIAHYFYGTR